MGKKDKNNSKPTKPEDYVEEIENRREELINELSDSDGEYDEIELNEILRDEFSEPEYQNTLIELGINNTDEELGLNEAETEEQIVGDDNKDKDKLLNTLLTNNKHIREIYFKLLNQEDKGIGKKPKFKGNPLIPSKDREFLILALGALYSTQSLSGKLHTNLSYFDDSMNTLLNNFRGRLSEYPDSILARQDMMRAIDIAMTEVNVVRNAIMSGRIGDLARDMVINSYNEKDERKEDDKVSELKKQLF